jgi:selenocysteine-specific elongation factor
LAELDAELARLLGATPVATDRGRPRLWIDRCFAAPGAGTVVTGTLTGGSLHLHDELHIVPGAPPGRRPVAVRVRSIQTHGTPREDVGPGHRVALGLLGAGNDRVDRASVRRGQAVVRLSQWAPTTTVDASLEVLAASPSVVGRRGAYQAYFGSGEHAVRLRVLGAPALEPGQRGLVRLHLPVPLPLLPGDRFVLRDAGPAATVGGGEVLDVAPIVPASRARPNRSVERVVAERGWVDVEDLERLTGERRDPTLGSRWVVDPTLLEETRARLVAEAEAAGEAGLDLAGVDARDRLVVAWLSEEGLLSLRDGRAWGRRAPDLRASAFLAALETSPFSPPDAATFGVDRGELRALLAAGLVVERDGFHFASSALRRGTRIVRELLEASPDGVTVSEVREHLGTTRKYALPFLSLLDAEGITRRRGDLRVAGPRLEGALQDSAVEITATAGGTGVGG